MPLQNRVLPDGKIVRANWRGTFMGNKGGRIHEPLSKSLLKRRWASKRWIICVTEFRQRKRQVMGNGYTELFFLDEVSALAAGHRPCFECRRRAAAEFSNTWISNFGKPDGSVADTMDRVLHSERIQDSKIIQESDVNKLPDGAMVACGDAFFAKKDGRFLQWSETGYLVADIPEGDVHLLTPASTVKVLAGGYIPVWHGELADGHS